MRESAAQYGVAEDIAEDMANIAAATGRTIEFATDVELGVAMDGDNTVAGSYDPATGIVKINNGELGEAADMIQGLSRKGTELGRAVEESLALSTLTEYLTNI